MRGSQDGPGINDGTAAWEILILTLLLEDQIDLVWNVLYGHIVSTYDFTIAGLGMVVAVLLADDF